MKQQFRWFCAILLALAVGTPLISGQALQSDRNAHYTIKKRVQVVSVYATVTNAIGTPIAGLEQENFRIYENGVEQKIVHFTLEAGPVSVCILTDTSGSMADKIDKVREAVKRFIDFANPKDDFCLIAFRHRRDDKGKDHDVAERIGEPFSDFTTGDDLQSKALILEARGLTPLLDAIRIGFEELEKKAEEEKKEMDKMQETALTREYAQKETRKIQHRRALLIISDGGDNRSRTTESEIKNAAKELDIQIYAIGIVDPPGYRDRTPEEAHGPELLEEITATTGGRVLFVEKIQDLVPIAQEISSELREQYVLQYVPKSNDDAKPSKNKKKKQKKNGEWRKLRVEVIPPKGMPPLHVNARKGYYYNPEEQ